jgi:hypothetical protein
MICVTWDLFHVFYITIIPCQAFLQKYFGGGILPTPRFDELLGGFLSIKLFGQL